MPQVFIPKGLYDSLLKAGRDPHIEARVLLAKLLDTTPPPHVRPLDRPRRK